MEGEELAVALQTPQQNNLKFMALSPHDGGQFVAVGGEAAAGLILHQEEP